MHRALRPSTRTASRGHLGLALRATLGAASLVTGCGPPAEEPVCEGAGVLCAVAGTGEAGYNGDGLPPLETQLNLPTAARVGPDGLLYIMDFNNQRARCLTGEGTVDTVAGNGEHAVAFAGAGVLDTPLENPIDFAFAPDGRMLFVSLHDPRVLALEADGTVGVLAGTGEVGDAGDGGPAAEALFRELAGIVVAPDGSVFVSDDEAARVRVIRPDGTIETVAGTGEEGYSGDGGPASLAQLAHPEGLALDGEGNLIIADTNNHRIRIVDKASGVIRTVAGTGERGDEGDGGPAVEAKLQWPSGVAVSPEGVLYIADTFNDRVRRVGLGGRIDALAGRTRGHAGDGGPAIFASLKGPTYLDLSDSILLIADTQNHAVRALHLR